MSLKLSSLKRWLTLEDSARYLSLVISEEVSTADLLQLTLEGRLTLSVMFPNTIQAVKYDLNDSAHEPVPHLKDTMEGLLARLDLFHRSIWALTTDSETLYEPNFDEMPDISGLWDFPCFQHSGNTEIIGRRLAESLSSALEADGTDLEPRPIFVRDPSTQEIFGLIKLSKEASEDFSADLSPRSKYALRTLPKDSFFGLKQDELQRFVASLEGLGSNSTATAKQPDSTSNDAELRRTQRTLAALVIGLAEKHPGYRNGEKPNASQLAKLATEHLRDGESDRTPHGFGETTARQTIAAALKACPELKG